MNLRVSVFLAALLLCSPAPLPPAPTPPFLSPTSKPSSNSSARSHASQRPRHGVRKVVQAVPGTEEEGGFGGDDGA